MVSDELFESYAAEEEAAASRATKSGNFEPREYETIKWVGCEVGKPTIFRAVGGPPNSKIDASTARFVANTIAIVPPIANKRIEYPKFSISLMTFLFIFIEIASLNDFDE